MRIAQIADIHIRNASRHSETKNIFKSLYDVLRPLSVDEIVVAGDLFHTKLNISPEALLIATEFIQTLSDIAPVVMIPGNHDCSVSSPDRMDSISPLVKIARLGKADVYEKTGLYQSKTNPLIQYAVFSILDSDRHKHLRTHLVNFKKENLETTIIGLYHGIVEGMKLDSGMRLAGLSTSLFQECDVVMLGDVHRHQQIRKNIIYAGSLFQNNFSETTEKGFVLWNLGETVESKFIEVPSEYKFLTVHLDEVDELLKTKAPLYMVRVVVDRYINDEEKFELIKKLSVKCKGYKLYYTSSSGNTFSSFPKEKISKKDAIARIKNVQTSDGLLDLLREHITKELDIQWEQEQWEKCTNIIKEAYTEFSADKWALFDSDRWTIKKIAYKNILSYKEMGTFNFEKYDKRIIGIVGKNYQGKSSLFSIISFALFGRTPFTKKISAAHLVSNEAKAGKTSIVLQSSGGQNYCIRRTITRVKASGRDAVRATVDLYEISKEGKEFLVNADGKVNTESVVESIFGTYEDFLTINYLYQKDIVALSGVSGVERKDILSRITQVDIIYRIFDYVKGKRDEINQKLSGYREGNFEYQLETGRAEKKILIKQRKKLEEETSKKEKEISKINETIGKIKGESGETAKTDIIKQSIEEQLKKTEQNIKEKDEEIKKYTDALGKKNKKTLRSQKKAEEIKFDTTENTVSELVGKLSVVESLYNSVSKIKKEIQTEKGLPCKDTAAYGECNLKKLVYDADYGKSIATIKEKIFSSKISAKESQKKIAEYDGMLRYLKKINDVKEEKTALQKQKKETQEQLNTIQQPTEKDKELLKLTRKREGIEKQLSGERKEQIKISEDIGKLIADIKDATQAIQVYKKNKAMLAVLDVLVNSLHRNGIPLRLISQIIPLVNEKIEQTLEGLVDFGVRLEEEGSNINACIMKEGKSYPLELASGAEKAFSNIAIRVALYSISLLPTIRIFLIDEALSAFDYENVENMHNLLLYLSAADTGFGSIFLISHDLKVRDMVDVSITIKKNQNGSSIIDEN